MRIGLLVALLALAMYLSSFRTITGIDPATNALLAYSFVRDRDPYLDEFAATYDKVSFWSLPVRGHLVSPYPPGASLLAVPVVAIGASAGIAPPQAAAITFVAKAAAAGASAASVFFVYLLAARTAGRRLALVVAALYAFGTVSWPISAGALWQHGPAQFFLSMGLLWLHPRNASRLVARSGIAFGLAVLCRLIDGAFALAALGYVLAARRSVAPPFGAWAAIPAGVFVGYGLATYGEPVSSGYLALNYGEVGPGPIDVAVGIAGSFIAPDRGLLVYSPFLVLALYELTRRALARGTLAPFIRAQLFAVVGIVVASAATVRWWGGYGYGERYLADALPILAFGLALWLRRHHRRRDAVLLALLAAPAIIVMALGALFYDWQNWSWERGRSISEAALQWTLDDPQWWYTLRHVPDRLDGLAFVSLAVMLSVGLFYARLWSVTPRRKA